MSCIAFVRLLPAGDLLGRGVCQGTSARLATATGRHVCTSVWQLASAGRHGGRRWAHVSATWEAKKQRNNDGLGDVRRGLTSVGAGMLGCLSLELAGLTLDL